MKINTPIKLILTGYYAMLPVLDAPKGWELATLETQEYPLRWQAVKNLYTEKVANLQVGDEIVIFDKNTYAPIWKGRITERRWRGMISGFAFAHRGKMRKDLFILADAAHRGNYIAIKRRK